MKLRIKKLIAAAAAAVLLLSGMPVTASAYTPSYTTVKIGLYYGSNAKVSANLQNAVGAGYLFGYYNANRKFVSVGAYTTTAQISVLKDYTMYYDGSNNTYEVGSSGSIVVGCYHIQLNSAYSSYNAAKTVADQYADGFVKFYNSKFYVCIGSYTSYSAASSAISSRGIGSCDVNSGTSYTVTVVETKTGKILFEYDCGTSSSLGILPATPAMISTAKTAAANGTYGSQNYAVSNGCTTWFRGYKYYGGFQYTRLNGGDLTVVNFVDIEDYVKGVIPYEMSPSWPLEALKAQAVCARSYVASHYNAHSSSGFDLCTTEDCQVYYGTNSATTTSDSAVTGTKGKYLLYNGSPCEAYFASSDGGATENSENVWVAAVPYIRGVIDPYEADIADSVSGYYFTITFSQSEITSRLQSWGYSCGTIVSMHVSTYTPTGNVYALTLKDANGKTFTFEKEDAKFIVRASSLHFTVNNEPIITAAGGSATVYVNDASSQLTITDPTKVYAQGSSGSSVLGSGSIYVIDGTGAKTTLPMSGTTGSTSLIPTNYTGNASSFVINGSGNGHNLGMSQWGAYSMAKYHSKTYDEILKFYYTGVTIG